ncbi:hypothetical protein EJB05_20115, partial [Eragrostis curvula]
MEEDGVVRSLADLDFAELERILPPRARKKRLGRPSLEAIPPHKWRNVEFTESNKAILEHLMDDQAKLK